MDGKWHGLEAVPRTRRDAAVAGALDPSTRFAHLTPRQRVLASALVECEARTVARVEREAAGRAFRALVYGVLLGIALAAGWLP